MGVPDFFWTHPVKACVLTLPVGYFLIEERFLCKERVVFGSIRRTSSCITLLVLVYVRDSCFPWYCVVEVP